MKKKPGKRKTLKFGDKKSNQPTLIALKEAERSPRATLSREADYRGFDLGKTGIIRSLLNFIATSQWKPRTKKGKKGLYLRLDETGDFWLENLETECKDPRNAEYYSDWKTNRTFNCERDVLQENHPDYEIFGGKTSVHKNINSKLDKLGTKADLDEVFQNPEDTEEYWQWVDKNLENIEIEEEVIF
jgi:hypothetical protein